MTLRMNGRDVRLMTLQCDLYFIPYQAEKSGPSISLLGSSSLTSWVRQYMAKTKNITQINLPGDARMRITYIYLWNKCFGIH